MLRNILSVVAGYVVLAVLTMLCVLALTGIFPEYAQAGTEGTPLPTVPVVLNVVLGTLCAVVGGYVTARVASHRHMVWVLVLAGLVFVFGIAHWLYGRGGPQPEWYLALLPVTGALGVSAGGWLGAKTRPV